MALTASAINDLVTATLNELGRLRFSQIATRWQRYEIMKRMMVKDKAQFDSGVGIKRTVMTDHSSAAQNVGMFDVDNVNVGDVLATLSVPWRHTTTNYAFEVRELLMNRGAEQIVNLLKVRRSDGMISLAESMETSAWNKPTTSSDTTEPFGFPYWLVYDATAGFNGGDPSGFTSGAGGLATATYTRWKNYTGNYTNVTKADLVDKMRTAYRKIRFESPVDIPDFRKGRGDQYRLYTNETVIKAFEKLGEAQNENLGRDLAPYDDTMSFRRNPIVWVPYLDDNVVQTDPVYMINMATFYPVFLRGDYLRETGPDKAANQHNVKVVHIDLTWNFLCTDRRANAVLATA